MNRDSAKLDRWVVEHLDVERLLADWRWLCPQKLVLVARNAFGDLFLRDDVGRVFRLDIAIGRFSRIADSEKEFAELAGDCKNREEWFAESDESDFAARGLRPGPEECIGFSIPVVLADSGSPNPAYIADLYEHVGFLGDVNRQIADLPDGAKVKLTIKR